LIVWAGIIMTATQETMENDRSLMYGEKCINEVGTRVDTH